MTALVMMPVYAVEKTVSYEPTEESLKQAEIPEWFIDGKLGIFMHWGPESIPGVASTWYARWMYEEGSEGYE
jgi:alpha-L-fucosidase